MDTLFLPGAAKIAAELSRALGTSATPLAVTRFPNDQRQVELPESRRIGDDLLVVQTFGEDVHGRLFELCLALDALAARRPRRLTAVLPYLPYSRSDRPAARGAPVGLGRVADMLERAGANRVATVSLHSTAAASAFRVPLIDVDPFEALFAGRRADRAPTVIVAPDLGGAKRAASLAALLGVPIAVMQKARIEGRKCVYDILGAVDGRRAVLVDDEINTGETLLSAASLLRERGALSVDVLAAHALFGSAGAERLVAEGSVEQIVVSDSTGLNLLECASLRVVPTAGLIAQALG